MRYREFTKIIKESADSLQDKYLALYVNGRPTVKFPYTQAGLDEIKEYADDIASRDANAEIEIRPVNQVRSQFESQNVSEGKPMSRPSDPDIAIRRLSSYIQRNIVDLASDVMFSGENYNEPYIDDRFVDYLTKADGTPATPVFNGGGKIELLGAEKQYLNIPIISFYRYRGFMYGGALINQIRQVLGYKSKTVSENGPFSYGAKKPRKGSVAANAAQKRQEQERGQQPIEPRDQMVGTAKLTKGVAEGSRQIPGDQVRGNEPAKASGQRHPFQGRLVGEQQVEEGKKDACYHKVKSRVKVWPSAYASGQLVQCRKRGAKNWGTGGKKK